MKNLYDGKKRREILEAARRVIDARPPLIGEDEGQSRSRRDAEFRRVEAVLAAVEEVAGLAPVGHDHAAACRD